MKLYKYVTPERADILRNGLIRFTQPREFNDPFELCDVVDSIYDKETNTLDILLHNTKIGAVLMDAMSTMLSGCLSQYFSNQVGVMSLTEKPDNLLMWAHYAREHTGFVIEFNGDHPFFNRRESEDDRYHHLTKVRYSPTRPSVSLQKYNAIEALLSKSTDWEYEQEWRMIMPLAEADEKIDKGGLALCLFKLPAGCISAVVFGCRASFSDKEQIIDILLDGDRYQHVEVRQSTLDEKLFQLRLCESPILHAKRYVKATMEKDFPKALEHANRALEVAPATDKGRWYGLRAGAYLAVGKNDEAMADLRRMKELAPERYRQFIEGAKATTANDSQAGEAG